MLRIILLSFPVLLTGGCASYSGYIGDGTFTDRGAKTAIDRYILDLGLFTPSVHEYQLGQLPLGEEFTVGFHIPGPSGQLEREQHILSSTEQNFKTVDEARDEAVRKGVIVEIILKTQKGRIIFKQNAPFADWTWSQSINGVDSFCYKRMSEDEKSDPGTYFIPKRREKYILQVHILAGEKYFNENDVRLLIKGGGWMA